VDDPNKQTRVLGYARCSTAEQTSEGMSLEAQVSRIRGWADGVGAQVIEIVRDGGVSGSTPLPVRSGGSRIAALLDATNPDADAVVVLKLDRLSSDATEIMALLKRFRSAKVGLVSVTEDLDLSTRHGRNKARATAIYTELDKELHPSKSTGLWRVIRGSMPF
jgi:site-specific DNA recombinase